MEISPGLFLGELATRDLDRAEFRGRRTGEIDWLGNASFPSKPVDAITGNSRLVFDCRARTTSLGGNLGDAYRNHGNACIGAAL